MRISVLLTVSAVFTAATLDRVYIPRPTGQYSVGKTQHVFDHTTLDDPMAPPESNRIGSFFVVTILYPTNRVPAENISLKYMDHELAVQIEAGWQIPTGELQRLYTHIQWQPPVLKGSPSNEQLPNLLFSPGAGMPCSSSTVVQAEMASRGYTVLCIDHPGESPYLQTPNTDYGTYGIPINDDWADIDFVYRVNEIRKSDLDALIALSPGLAEPYGAPSNQSTYLHFGFSMGGSIGTHLTSSHDSVLAGLNFDGAFIDALFNETVNAHKPFLMLRNDQDMSGDPTWDYFQAVQTGWWEHLKVSDARHLDFSDVGTWMDLLELRGRAPGVNVGTISGCRIRDIMTEFTVGFFDKVLQKKALDLSRQLPSVEWPDVTFVNGSIGV
jgi:pimeloyl-ACP methyl ester carboxylesterase